MTDRPKDLKAWAWCWEPIGDDDVAYIRESLTEVER